MHFGTPVFLSRLTSLPEVGGSQAAYFDDFSPRSMRATIESEMPRLQAQRDDIRRRARLFDWSACISRYVQLYGELISGLAPRARAAA
jgi:glycosyltransferase involved in cell wall biosynthesis